MIYKNQYLVENVVGKWGALNGSDPLFTFSSDSFFVNDISKGYHYQIINKSIIIDYPNVFRVLRNVKVNEDTLSFIDDYGVVVKGYRIQNN